MFKIPDHWDKEDKVIKIAINNLLTAIDDVDSYESLDKAVLSYAQNASDTCIENGMTAEDAMNCSDIVNSLYRHNYALLNKVN